MDKVIATMIALYYGWVFRGYEPTLMAKSIFEVDYDLLWDMGIRVLAFDFDNTLADHGKIDVREDVVALFVRLRAKGFVILIASNSGRARSEVADKLECEIFQAWHSLYPRKPWRSYFRLLCEGQGVRKHKVAMIGDKLFFDCLGAEREHLTGVLVNPCGSHDLPLDRLYYRPAEEIYLRRHGLARP